MEVHFTADSEISDRIQQLLQSKSAQAILKHCSPHVFTGFPGECSEEALFHHQRANGYSIIGRYELYIGKDRDTVDEHGHMGAQLPATVLDDPDTFQAEVLTRIRKYVGVPEDN